MKITKSQLKQIIKEEIERAFKTGVPDEDVLKYGGDLEKYPLTPEELESDRIAQELEDAWVAAGNSKKRLGWVDSEILDMAMAVRDGDMTMEDALVRVNNLVAEGKNDEELMDEKWNKQQKGKKRAVKVAKRKSKKKKCKGSGCVTPDEVKKYAAAIQRDADNKGEIEDYYGAATAAARQPGSLGGTAVVEKKGYKK